MFYLISKIILCLLAAGALGFLLGWLLKSTFIKEQMAKIRGEADAQRLRLLGEAEQLRTKIASQESRLSKQESALTRAKEEQKRYQDAISELREENLSLKEQVESAATSIHHGAVIGREMPGKDNLQEIRGIGKVLESRLNELGVFTFRQIAGWDESDIEQIAEQIGPFRDRITEDRWVEQARERVSAVPANR